MAEKTKIWNPLEGKEKKPPRQKKDGHGIARYNRHSTTGTAGIDRELSTEGSTPIVADSFGNIIPNSTVQNIGTETSPWKGGDFEKLVRSGAFDSYQLHDDPVQIGGIWFPGKKLGLAMPPTAAPATTVVLSGGSIADGTYYCKVTYVNDNGETTPSPAATITVSGGGGAAKVSCSQNDRLWGSGAYGLRVYFSNDNVNFYLHAPVVTTQDFMIDSNTHYVQISAGFYYTSFTFSGTTPPTTNTATIDPLQVALNATMRQSDYAVQVGSLFVPVLYNASGAVTSYALTTPLITVRNAKIDGYGHWPMGQNSAGTRIFYSGTNAKKAAIMSFGGFVSMSGIAVTSPGHAVMFLSSSGYQGGHTVVDNVDFQTSDTTNTYAALVFVGPYQYDYHFSNFHLRGGKTCIQYKNAAGGEHYFANARWDAGGNSFIQSIPGWSDPDNGVQLATQGFGVGSIRLTNIRTEQGTGILFDCVGLGIYFDRVEVADHLIGAGIDSVGKFGRDATYLGTAFLSMKDTAFPFSNNARVGVNWTGVGGTLELSGNSGLGAGHSTGSWVALDLNNLTGMFISDFSNNSSTNWDPASTGSGSSDAKVINRPANTRILALSSGYESGSGVKWQEIQGGLQFVPRVGSAWEEDKGWRIYIPNSGGLARQFVLEAGSFYSNATLLSINQSTLAATWYGNVSPNAPAVTHGGATNYWAYNGTIGATTARSGAFTTITSTGKYTNYNSIATVGNGIPAEYATIDLTAQTAAKTATLLYAVPASGQGVYRVSWVATITTAASTSSVLGGTNGFQVEFTSPTDSVVKTTTPTTATAFTSAGNTTAIAIGGAITVFAKASTNINYLFDYTSVGATPMAYELHIVCEKM